MKALHMLAVSSAMTFVLFSGGCKKDPVGPTLPKNPREYTWTVDTLAYPGSFQTIMRAIWGSSSNDIYVAGHNNTAFGNMYHWNGHVWTNVRLVITEGGPLSRIGSFAAIFGISGQDIYAAGYIPTNRYSLDGFLIHFNGTTWREISLPSESSLETVWGRSPDTVWIGGWDGFLAHYTASRFVRDTVPYAFDTTGRDIVVRQIEGDARRTFLVLGVSPRVLHREFYYLYERVGSQWIVRDGTYEYPSIFIAPGGTMYRSGYGGIQRKAETTWTTVLSVPYVGRRGMAASSESNIFAAGMGDPVPTSRLYHYNGTDWFEYTHLRMEGVEFSAVWTDGKEVFAIGQTIGSPMKTIVLHGR